MRILNALLSAVEGEVAGSDVKGLTLNFSGETFLESLKYMGIGMVCIFAVVGVIAIGVWLLNKLTAKKKPQETQSDDE